MGDSFEGHRGGSARRNRLGNGALRQRLRGGLLGGRTSRPLRRSAPARTQPSRLFKNHKPARHEPRNRPPSRSPRVAENLANQLGRPRSRVASRGRFPSQSRPVKSSGLPAPRRLERLPAHPHPMRPRRIPRPRQQSPRHPPPRIHRRVKISRKSPASPTDPNSYPAPAPTSPNPTSPNPTLADENEKKEHAAPQSTRKSQQLKSPTGDFNCKNQREFLTRWIEAQGRLAAGCGLRPACNALLSGIAVESDLWSLVEKTTIVFTDR